MAAGTPSAPPRFFTGSRAVTLRAIAGRVVPDEGPLAPGANSQRTLEVAELFVQSQDERTRAKLRLLLRIFEWGAVLRFGRPFSRLPAKKQDAYLRAWEFSRLQLFRFGFSSLRNLVLVSFYAQPTSWLTMGYPGPVREAKPAKP